MHGGLEFSEHVAPCFRSQALLVTPLPLHAKLPAHAGGFWTFFPTGAQWPAESQVWQGSSQSWSQQMLPVVRMVLLTCVVQNVLAQSVPETHILPRPQRMAQVPASGRG